MTALAEPASLKPDMSEWRQGVTLFRAKDLIRKRFRDPELTPGMVASFLNISVRYLQELFSGEDTTRVAISDAAVWKIASWKWIAPT